MTIEIRITRDGDEITIWTRNRDDVWCQQWRGDIVDGGEEVIEL